jgi:hypothetical protein
MIQLRGARPTTARDRGREQTEAGGGQLRRVNSQAFSSSGRGAMTQYRGARPATAAAEWRAMEAESKLRQEAANCVAQTARLFRAPGEGQ